MVKRTMGICPNADLQVVGVDHDRAGRQVQRLPKRLALPEGTGLEGDSDPARLEDVALVRVGIVLRQEQVQVAVFDGVDPGGNVTVADGHDAAGIFRRAGPDDVVAAHAQGGGIR